MSVAIDGYLKKKSRSNSVLKRAWNKRWFVLAGNILSYSNSSKDKKTSGTFNLANIHNLEKKGTLEFQLVFPERELHLKAADMVEARRWLEALEAARRSSPHTHDQPASLRNQAASQAPPPSGYDFRGRHGPVQARPPPTTLLPHEEVRASQSSLLRADAEKDAIAFPAAATSPSHPPNPPPVARDGGPPSPRTLLSRPDLAKQSIVFGKALANQQDRAADDVSEISEQEAEHAVAQFVAPSPTPPKRASRPDPGPTHAARPPPQSSAAPGPPPPELDDVLSITSTLSKPEVAPLRVKEEAEPDMLALSPQNRGQSDSSPAPVPEETPVFAMDQVEDFDSEPEDEQVVEMARSPAQSPPTLVQHSKQADVVWSPDTPEISSPPREEERSPIPMQAVAGVNVDKDFLDDDWDSEDEESLQSPAEPLPRHVPSPVGRKVISTATEASKPKLEPKILESPPGQPANAGVAVDADFLDDDWDSD